MDPGKVAIFAKRELSACSLTGWRKCVSQSVLSSQLRPQLQQCQHGLTLCIMIQHINTTGDIKSCNKLSLYCLLYWSAKLLKLCHFLEGVPLVQETIL